METKYCKTCRQHLLKSDFDTKDQCKKCYKKEYYLQNKNKIKERSREYKAAKSLKKKQEGKYNWSTSLKSEEAKFKFFLEQHNLKIDEIQISKIRRSTRDSTSLS